VCYPEEERRERGEKHEGETLRQIRCGLLAQLEKKIREIKKGEGAEKNKRPEKRGTHHRNLRKKQISNKRTTWISDSTLSPTQRSSKRRKNLRCQKEEKTGKRLFKVSKGGGTANHRPQEKKTQGD